VTTLPVRAAIYIGTALFPPQHASACLDLSLESCLRHCMTRGYQLSRQHIYQGGPEPFWSNTPTLLKLRQAAVQRQFDVLVITSAVSIGYIAPWKADRSVRTINGYYISREFSSRSEQVVIAFYQHDVRIESAVKRNGTHDIYQQMLSEALQFARQMKESTGLRALPGAQAHRHKNMLA
jgi:hypothetical protein